MDTYTIIIFSFGGFIAFIIFSAGVKSCLNNKKNFEKKRLDKIRTLLRSSYRIKPINYQQLNYEYESEIRSSESTNENNI